MPSAEIDAIGARIVRFLEQALAKYDRERDIAESEQICKILLTSLDNAAKWEHSTAKESEAKWQEALECLGEFIAEAFKERAEQWADAARLIRIYVRAIWVEDHARAQKHMQRRLPTGIVLYYVELNVLNPFVRQLILSAAADQRIAFFQSNKDWEVWRALADAINSILMEPAELMELFHAFDVFSRNDGARGAIFEKLMSWAGEHQDIAERVVEEWLNRNPHFTKLDREPVRLLVEAIMQRHGREARMFEWRDRLIQDLVRHNDEESWKLAALLACFAWPLKTPASTRHFLLLRHVERLPERLVKTGLLAMTRDAKEHPREAIETTRQLLELQPEYNDNDYPLIVANIADQALRGARNDRIGISFADLFPVLLSVPPEQASRGLGLDSFLADLLDENAAQTRIFVGQWLEKHASAIRGRLISLEDILPLLVHKLRPVEEARWTIGFMLSPSVELRTAALFLLAARHSSALPIESFAELDEMQTRALAHLLAGGPILGRFWIPALFRLAIAQPTVIDTISSILLEDAAINYPSSCRASLTIWVEAEGLPVDAQKSINQAIMELKQRLEAQEASYTQKRSISELISCQPAVANWLSVQQRIMDASLQSTQQQSVFMRLATKMPIARGSQALMSSNHENPAELKEYSHSIEIPIDEVLDPLGARLSRFKHHQEAEALLAARSSAQKG